MTKKNTPTGIIQTSRAVIQGLDQKPYYSKEKLAYFWDITFEDHSVNFGNLAMIYMGKTEEEANEYYHELVYLFNSQGIKSGKKIIVLSDSGEVIAITAEGCVLWFDVTDKFRIKSHTKILSDLIRKNHL